MSVDKANDSRSSHLERHLLLWLTVASVFALWWPKLGVPRDPFLETAAWISYLVAATMCFVGWMLPKEQVDQVLLRSHLVGCGTALQYLSMPALAWGVGTAFGLDGPERTGMMLVGAVPGAMASNVLTLNARGNTSYSVSLTTAATLLSPFLVPLALSFTLGAHVKLDPQEVMRRLALTVVAPVVVGHLLRRVIPRMKTWAERAGPFAANITILWIIAVVVASNRERLLSEGVVEMLPPLLALNAAGYTVGYVGGVAIGLDEGMRRALTLEIGMQNAGVGTLLAMTLFTDPATALPPAIYTFGCMFTGTALARWWSARAAS